MAYHLSGPAEDATLSDLEVRTSAAPQTMVAAVRQAVAEAEPRLPAYDIAPLLWLVTYFVARSLSSLLFGVEALDQLPDVVPHLFPRALVRPMHPVPRVGNRRYRRVSDDT